MQFHAYYEDRIKFYELEASSGGDKNESKEEQPKPLENSIEATDLPKKKPVREKTQKVASAIDPIAKALLDQRSKISQARANQAKEEGEAAQQQQKQEEGNPSTTVPARDAAFLPPPPPLELVHIVAPSSLSTVQIETIQLVAQFAALDSSSSRGGNTNGQFLQQLTLREWNNPIFAFCQPRHSHFAYFSALVDAYRRIFSVWSAASAKAGASAQEMETDGSTKGESDSSHAGQLDQKRHDQSPKTVGLQHVLQQAAYRCEYERDWQKRKSEQEEEEGEVIAIDWHDFVVVETIDFPIDEVVEVSMLPPPPSSATLTTVFGDNTGAAAEVFLPTSGVQGKDNAMEESDDDEQEENIRVVPSYTPKVVAASNPQASRAIDPITGKSVNVADMPEHMRIQLLDPKWAEERKKFQEKQKDSNLVSGDAIASNISRFAQARGDLFGKSVSLLLY